MGKAVLYRMSPANIPALTAVRPDVCVLANNHVLDFGRTGLAETLSSLAAAGVQASGAGRDIAEARRPAAVPVRDDRRILVFAMGMATSGIPSDWAATADRSGVDFVREPSAAAADEVVERVRTSRRPGDVVVVSVHWGSNWGYGVSRRGDRVRASPRRRRGGRRARALVTPSAADRGVPRQAHPLRLR